MALMGLAALVAGALVYATGSFWGAAVSRMQRLAAGLLTAIFGFGLTLATPYPPYFWWSIPLVGLLVVAGVVDRLHQVIPNRLVLLLGAWALVARIEFGHWVPAVVLALGVFFFYFLINVITRGGLGMGDVKFSTALMLALGYPWGLVGLTFGSLIAGLYAAFLLVAHRRGKREWMALGPFLALGGWVGAAFMLHR